MKFSAVVCSLALTVVAATDVSIRTGSTAGRNLMEKARQLNNNNNNYYYSWIENYSIKFDGCAAVPQFEREEGVRANLLAKFKLCPSDKCGSCPNAGEYVVDMREFVEAYQEAKEQANQAVCESAEYQCEYQCQNGQYQYNGNANNYYDNNGNANNNNNGNNDEYCTYQCLVDQNLGYCAQDAEQEGEVNMNELAECRPLNEEQQNNNNGYYNGNSNYQMYYVGAYCTGSGVYAGVFTDAACTKKAPSGTYEKYNYGYSLPTEPMVSGGCMSCKAQNNNNNNNGNNNNNNNNNGNAISEVCEDLYEQAAKCEKKVKGTNYQDNSSCDLIHNVIPKLNSALNSMVRPNTAKVFAWIFGIAVVFMGWYIYRLHKTVIRQKVNLGTLMTGQAA